MQLSKMQFGILLMALFVLPFFAYRAIWLLQSVPVTGTMCFMGKSLNGQLSSSYPVIKFISRERDTVFFNGLEETIYQPGDQIPVRYQKNNPSDARINHFAGIWQETVIYAMVPLVFLLIVFLHPGIIPRGARLVVGGKGICKIMPANLL